MSLGKRLINIGAAAAAACTTDSTDPFGDSSGVALYSLDYDASDASGSYDGESTDVTFGVGGQINYGARFNGSSSKIVTTLNANGFSQIAISCWINTSLSSGTGSGHIVSANDGTNWCFLSINKSTGIVTFGASNGGSSIFSATHTGAINDGNWHHVVGNYNGTNATLYIDKTGHTPVSATASLSVNTAFGIGYRNTASPSGTYYTGDIDQVRIFSSALNQTEVDTLFAETACVYTATTTDNDYPTTNAAYYKLDNSAEDEKGSYDGTESNIEYRFGRFGQAAVFNGSSSRIDTNYSIPSNTSDYTLSMWIYMPTTSSYGRFLAGNINSSAANGFYTSINTNGTGRFYLRPSSGSASTIQGSIVMAAGQWHHFVITSSSTTNTLYINGQQDVTASRTTVNFASSVTLGRAGDYSADYFLGNIDQVRIYDTALSDSQVTELYNEKPETDTSNFKAVLYVGNGVTNYISNVGMDLETGGGLVWMKDRENTFSNTLYDSVRGTGTSKAIFSDSTVEEGNRTDIHNFVSFDANGFTLGATSHTNNIINKTGDNLVAWNWKGGGDAVAGTGTGVSNVSVSANTDAGFSIVKYTGGNGASDTVNHGLTDAEMIILKDLDDGTNQWRAWHKDLTANHWLYLNLTNQEASAAIDGGIRNVDANTFGFINGTTGGVEAVNSSASDYIAYVWKSVAGYSKIGSYAGNSSTNKITLDFAPSWVMIKLYDVAGGNWFIYDNKRNPTNPADLQLEADTSAAEHDTGTAYELDFLSDGFELQGGGGAVNTTGRNYIYMAFK